MIVLTVFLVLIFSTALVYLVSLRFNLRPLRFVLGNIAGYIFFALFSNLVFSIFMGDLSAIFADYGSLLGGGLSLTAVVISMITSSQPTREQRAGLEFADSELAPTNYNTLEIFWALAIRGLIAVVLAIISAIVIDFVVFVIYGFIGFEITDLPILIARIIYIIVSIVVSYLISGYLFRKKTKFIHQALYSNDSVSVPKIEQNSFIDDKPKKRTWLWWIGGCGLLGCISVLGIVAFLLFYPSEEPSFPLDGKVSYPLTVKKGEQFDFIITLTNSTTNPIFIKHVVLQTILGTPSFLDGAKVISVDPIMDSERIAKNDVQYAYFQDIQPDETLTFVFHMQAETVGSYIQNVGVYAKHPSLGEPNFQVAFHVAGLEIEIMP